MRSLPLAATLAVLASSASAQLEFTEILFDPIGPDAGNQIVEIQNTSGATFTPVNWFLCAPFRYGLMPSIAIPAGGVVRCHIGVAGADTVTDFYFPAYGGATPRPLTASDTMQIYKSGNFGNDSDIVDFVSWGGGTLRITQAVPAQWPSNVATVAGPFTEGHSIAFAGGGNGPEFWYRDASPTLGAANPTSSSVTLGAGCTTSIGVLGMTVPSPAVDGNLDFIFRVTGGPSGAAAAIFIGPPSGGIPVFGCSLEVLSFTTVGSNLDPSGTTDFPLPVLFMPNGFTMGFQAFALDVGAPNQLFGNSAGERITFGL